MNNYLDILQNYGCPQCGADTSNPCGCIDESRQFPVEGIQVVPINQVNSIDTSTESDIQKMMRVLERQGQIEPLQVRIDKVDGKYVPFMRDVWANEIIHAANRLGWNSLLISIMKRYEY